MKISLVDVFFCAVALFLFSGFDSFAYPNVGDSITYSVSNLTLGKKYNETRKIISFDASKGQFIERATTMSSGGVLSTNELSVPLASYLNSSSINQLLIFCSRTGSIKTMPVGGQSLSSCKMMSKSSSENSSWFADIPFGKIRIEQTVNGQHLIKVMSSFHLGENK